MREEGLYARCFGRRLFGLAGVSLGGKVKKKISCPLCGEMITRGYLQAHKAQMHGENRTRSAAEAAKSRPASKPHKQADGNERVSCKRCGALVKRKDLPKHRKTKHPTASERVMAILGPDAEVIDEARKKKLTVSGGAPGLGKRS